MAVGLHEVKKSKSPLYCSFCGKRDNEVSHMVAGPTVFICNECVTLANVIIAADMAGTGARVPAKPMKDFAPGELMFTAERIGDDKNNMEIREVFFRREDGPTRYCSNVRVTRLGIVQGDPYDTESKRPRFARWGKPDHTEADGRTLANGPGFGGSVWAARFAEHLPQN